MHKKATAFVAVLAMSAFLVIGFVGPANAATFTNACRNSAVPTNWDQISVTTLGTAPAGPVAPGASVTLSNISLTMAVPAAIFLAGYNLGLLTVGVNNIPGDIHEVIDASNTVELSQSTNTVSTTLTTTITDPDGVKGSGDETATDASATVNFNDQTWTAGSSGTIGFHEHRDDAITGVAGGGIVAVASLAGGFITVEFHCTPGTVTGSNPGTPTFADAPNMASVAIFVDTTPVTNAGPDQTVASGALVTLDGSASADSDGDVLTYAWTQTGGTTVTLSSTSVAKPTFTAPTGPDTLTFQLETCDPALNCSNDSVTITVSPPVITVIDAAMNAIISGPIRTAAGDKTLVAKVTNNGTGSLTVCDTNVSWAITVNGTATTGSVTSSPACKTLSPGASVRLKFKWTFGTGEVSPGATIDFTATVSVTGDVNAGNNSDTETRTAK